MAVVNGEIVKMVFATLLSLSVYGIVGQTLNWWAEKCPWDTERTKFITLIIMAVISGIYLLSYFRKRNEFKTRKYSHLMSLTNSPSKTSNT